MERQIGEYKILSRVGSGGFGEIYVVSKEGEKNAYILKVLREDSLTEDNIKAMQKEIDILLNLNKDGESEYIPRIYYPDKENINCELKENRPYYVIDFISKGNLYYYLNSERGFPEKYAKVVFKKIIKGFQFCHNKNICHLDIKPDNIVLDKNYNPIIIDFGQSEKIKNEKGEIIKYDESKGTNEYRCPEIWEEIPYKGIEADIFSLGAVLFNLITGNCGFTSSTKRDSSYELIIKKGVQSYWKKMNLFFHKEFSNEFKQLYFKMVAFKPSERPSIEEILNSEWLKEINNLNQEEELKLENEVKDYLNSICDKMSEDKKEITIAEKMKSEGYNSRGGDDDKIIYFGDNFKPAKISENTIIINHHLKLSGSFQGFSFMNSLICEIEQKYEDKCFVEASKKSLKFKVQFELEKKSEKDDENEEPDYCEIIIELFECEKGKYLLDFLRTGGKIPDYYHYFTEIKELIMGKLIK